MSRCGWESLKEFFQEARAEEDAVPGGAVAIQSFGDFLGFNPHLQILGTDGCFYGDGMFRVAPRFETKHLEETCPPSRAQARRAGLPSQGLKDACPPLEGSFPRVRSLKTWSACFYHGGTRASTSFVGQGYNPEMGRPWKSSLVILVRLWWIIRASLPARACLYRQNYRD
jgi:hypothetical protein